MGGGRRKSPGCAALVPASGCQGSAPAPGRAGGLADGPPCGRGGLCPGWTVSSSSVLLARRKRRRTARHPACVHAPAGLAPVPSPREAGNDAGGLPAGIWGLVLGEGARWGTLRSVTGTRRLHSLFTKLFKTRPLISTFSRGAITTSSFVVTSR